MNEEPSKTYVVFRSALFSFAWPKEGPDLAPPWGKDCAAFVKERLRAFDEVTSINGPHQDESAWTLDVILGGERYELHVHWALIGEPPVDCWVIQVYPVMGLIGWLFRRPLQHFSKLLKNVFQTLETTEGISDVQWMNFEEFSNVY
ncbi:hypothetical protein M4951_04385 [Blastopirellula sp. J2-11]|uniref:hypothetical protein n=1 Tax=Blastopirellula sp. J2-11 TaxID=2943192 RepID=UPI0021C73FFE|nr:hypothetical protein [Blastopirellula sp. J2-11]UUO07550.1 hypothetical protein M4951_04385 [Blastopirellula sp. J2-11]